MQDRSQAAALDKLHGVVVDALVAADSEDGHDMSVVKLRGGLRLDLKPLALPGVNCCGEWQHLQGDAAAERHLLGLVDDPHPPPTDLAEDAVVAELRSGGNAIGRISGRNRLRPAELRGCCLDQLQSGQALAEVLSDLGVPGQEVIPRPGTPGTRGFEIRLERGDHAGVVPDEIPQGHGQRQQ